MIRKASILYAVIAAVALAAGTLVYLLDRQPDHTYFVAFGLISVHAPYPLFGVAGYYLPAFLHVYAFILLTTAIAGRSSAGIAGIGAAWFLIASLFELGQHPAVAPAIAAAMPAWLAHVPLLENTAAYFLRGTFDPLDFFAIALGTVAAVLTVVLSAKRPITQPEVRPRTGAWRRIALGGVTLSRWTWRGTGSTSRTRAEIPSWFLTARAR